MKIKKQLIITLSTMTMLSIAGLISTNNTHAVTEHNSAQAFDRQLEQKIVKLENDFEWQTKHDQTISKSLFIQFAEAFEELGDQCTDRIKSLDFTICSANSFVKTACENANLAYKNSAWFYQNAHLKNLSAKVTKKLADLKKMESSYLEEQDAFSKKLDQLNQIAETLQYQIINFGFIAELTKDYRFVQECKKFADKKIADYKEQSATLIRKANFVSHKILALQNKINSHRLGNFYGDQKLPEIDVTK